MLFEERVRPNLASYLLSFLAGLGIFAVFLPIAGLLAFFYATIVTCTILTTQIALSPKIVITSDTLRVGKASIALRHLGVAQVYSNNAAREQLGPALDARSFLRIQGSVPQIVKVEILDKNDPAPYWIFSTRHGDEILKALG